MLRKVIKLLLFYFVVIFLFIFSLITLLIKELFSNCNIFIFEKKNDHPNVD